MHAHHLMCVALDSNDDNCRAQAGPSRCRPIHGQQEGGLGVADSQGSPVAHVGGETTHCGSFWEQPSIFSGLLYGK